MTPLATISLCVGVGALVLLALGLRGRRLDRLPRCRACGYDVSGIDDACPECGRWLGGRFSIRHGARKRRPVLLTLGLLLLLSLSLPGLWWWTGRDTHANRPTWRLLIEAGDERGHWGDESPAIDELIARWDNGALSAAAIEELSAMVSDAWARGAHDSALRRRDLFERCLLAGSMSDGQLRMAFEGAMKDLTSDDVWGNAAQGERLIRMLGTPAIEELPRYLDSPDRQQALRAAELLSAVEPERHRDRLTELAIDSLRDDEHRWNLSWGRRFLTLHADASAIEDLAMVIDDEDAQLRFSAKEVLSRVCVRTGVAPPPEVIDAWIVMLRAGAEGRVRDAVDGLVAHMPASETPLRRALRTSNDPQQRFVAAYALGMGSAAGSEAIALLIEHLGDNDISGDAARAAAALYHSGDRARPAILEARDSADAQRAAHARDLLWALSLPEGVGHTYTKEDTARLSRLWFP